MTSILVVDDEESIRQILTDALQEDGYCVRQACQGAEALALALRELPDLVLTDLMMPVMTGADLIRQLKNHAATRQVPIVLLTAAGRVPAEEVGADAILLKPFELAALLALVAQHTARASGRRSQPE